MTATPTKNQYDLLLMLGSGAAWVAARKRLVEPLLRREWVTGERQEGERYWHWVRITPDGLHALARAVEKYGLPPLGRKSEEQT